MFQLGRSRMRFVLILVFSVLSFESIGATCEEVSEESLFAFEQNLLSEMHRFDPKKGTGLLEVDNCGVFSSAYIEKLFAALPKRPQKSRLDLIRRGRPFIHEALGFLGNPQFDQALLEPIFSYANRVLIAMNKALSEPERGRMTIDTLGLAISDSSQSQVGENWHTDSMSYMTFITNLKGAGTLWDNSGSRSIQNSFGESRPDVAPSTIRELPVGTGLLMNGELREFLLGGPGTYSALHRAPIGQARLAIVIFLTPQKMDRMDIFKQLKNDPKLKKEIFMRFFE